MHGIAQPDCLYFGLKPLCHCDRGSREAKQCLCNLNYCRTLATGRPSKSLCANRIRDAEKLNQDHVAALVPLVFMADFVNKMVKCLSVCNAVVFGSFAFSVACAIAIAAK